MSKPRNRVRVQFGKELAKIRIDMDETVGDMCKRLDIHPTYLSRIEVGAYPLTIGVAQKIKDVYEKDFFSMITKEATGKVIFHLAQLSEADRNTVLEIHRRYTPAETTSPAEPPSASKSGVAVAQPSGTPDVDGVDFVGEDELDGLGDLDD